MLACSNFSKESDERIRIEYASKSIKNSRISIENSDRGAGFGVKNELKKIPENGSKSVGIGTGIRDRPSSRDRDNGIFYRDYLGIWIIPRDPKNRDFGTGIPENPGRDPDPAGH
jgi:hypothetical protein